MIILLPLLRRLPIRIRAIVGAVVLVLGVIGLLAGAVVAGAISAAVGLIFLGSAWSGHRRAPVAG